MGAHLLVFQINKYISHCMDTTRKNSPVPIFMLSFSFWGGQSFLFSSVQLDYLLEENVLKQEKRKKPNQIIYWRLSPGRLIPTTWPGFIPEWAECSSLNRVSVRSCINNSKYCDPLCTWPSPWPSKKISER